MATQSHGRCTTCNVIWCWPSTKHTPRVTKGEAFCEVCGAELERTAAGLAKNIPVKTGVPVRARAAAALQAKRAAPQKPQVEQEQEPPAGPQEHEFLVRVVVSGHEDAAHQAIESALDGGDLQAAVNGYEHDEGPVRVESASVVYGTSPDADRDLLARAISYTLDRAQMDADFGYLLGPGTEAFRLLCEAEATVTGKPLDQVTKDRGRDLSRHPRRYLSTTEHEEAQAKEAQRDGKSTGARSLGEAVNTAVAEGILAAEEKSPERYKEAERQLVAWCDANSIGQPRRGLALGQFVERVTLVAGSETMGTLESTTSSDGSAQS